jgi:hypothetical protein
MATDTDEPVVEALKQRRAGAASVTTDPVLALLRQRRPMGLQRPIPAGTGGVANPPMLSNAPAGLPTPTRQVAPETSRRDVATPAIAAPPENPLSRLNLAPPPAEADRTNRTLREIDMPNPTAKNLTVAQQQGRRAPTPGEALAEFQKTPALPDKKLAIGASDNWLMKLGKEAINAEYSGVTRPLTTPENLELMGAMHAQALPAVLNRLASAWFAAGAVGQIPEQLRQGIKAVKERGPTAIPALVIPPLGSAAVAAGAGREAVGGLRDEGGGMRDERAPTGRAAVEEIEPEMGKQPQAGTLVPPAAAERPAPGKISDKVIVGEPAEAARRAAATPATGPTTEAQSSPSVTKPFAQNLGDIIEKHIGDQLDEKLRAAGISASAKPADALATGTAPTAEPVVPTPAERPQAGTPAPPTAGTMAATQRGPTTAFAKGPEAEQLEGELREAGHGAAVSVTLREAQEAGDTPAQYHQRLQELRELMESDDIPTTDDRVPTTETAGQTTETQRTQRQNILAPGEAVQPESADVQSTTSSAASPWKELALPTEQPAAEPGPINRKREKGGGMRGGEAPANLIEQMAANGIRINVSAKGVAGALYKERVRELTTTFNKARGLFTTQGGQPLDEAAQTAYNLNLINDPTGDALLDALEAAGKRRPGGSAETQLKTRDKQDENFARAVAGKTTETQRPQINVDELKVGDAFTLDGERLRVKAIDPDTGDVTVEDGRKFGRQRLSSGAVVPMDRGTGRGSGQTTEAQGTQSKREAFEQLKKTVPKLLSSESGAALNPAAVLGPAVEKSKQLAERVSDYMTIDATPGLRRLEPKVAVAAREMSYAPAAVEPIVNDVLAKVWPDSYTDPGEMSKAMRVINAENIVGGYDSLVARAELLRKQANLVMGEEQITGDQRQAFLAEANKMDEMARKLAAVRDIGGMRRQLQEIKATDPDMVKTLDRWKAVPQDDLDKLYQEEKRQDPKSRNSGRGPVFGTRVQLLPIKKVEADASRAARDEAAPANRPPGMSAANVRRDPYMRLAELTGEYSDDAQAVLTAAYAHRWPNVAKLRFYNELIKSGAAIEEAEGAPRPEKVQGKTPSRLEVPMPETGYDGRTRMVQKTLWVRDDVYREVRNALHTDLDTKTEPITKIFNTAQMTQFADPAAHLKNQHTVVANLPALKTDFGTAVRKMPVLGTGWAAKEMGSILKEMYEDGPEIRAEKAAMARAGLLRQKSEALHGITHLLKTHEGLYQTDTAVRMLLNRFYDKAVEAKQATGTADERAQFVTQVGEYNTRLMGEWAKRLKQSGFAPFVVAGRNFNRANVRHLTGHPGFESPTTGAAASMRARNILMGAVTTGAMAMMLNYASTGKVGGRKGTPLGAWNYGVNEDGSLKVFDLMQLNGMRRGLKTTGANAVIEGMRAGKTWNDIAGESIGDMTQSRLHPYVGPTPGFLLGALTGTRLDMRGGPQPVQARNVPGKFNKLVERTRVAGENTNILGASLLGVHEPDKGYWGGVGNAVVRAPLAAIGVQRLRTPAVMTAGEKMRELAPEGGTTPTQASRAAFRRKIEDLYLADPKTGPVAARKAFAEAYKAGEASKTDADAIMKRVADRGQPLAGMAKRLAQENPQGLMDVWRVAGDDEKAEIRKAVAPQGAAIGVMRSTSGEKAMLVYRLFPDATRRAIWSMVNTKVRLAKNLDGDEREAYLRELMEDRRRMMNGGQTAVTTEAQSAQR